MRAKLYVYPYRIAERKPHPILWSFDTEALKEIAKNFKNKSVFSVEVKKKTIILRLIECLLLGSLVQILPAAHSVFYWYCARLKSILTQY